MHIRMLAEEFLSVEQYETIRTVWKLIKIICNVYTQIKLSF